MPRNCKSELILTIEPGNKLPSIKYDGFTIVSNKNYIAMYHKHSLKPIKIDRRCCKSGIYSYYGATIKQHNMVITISIGKRENNNNISIANKVLNGVNELLVARRISERQERLDKLIEESKKTLDETIKLSDKIAEENSILSNSFIKILEGKIKYLENNIEQLTNRNKHLENKIGNLNNMFGICQDNMNNNL